MWQIKSPSSWGEGKAKTNHLPKVEGRLVPVLVLEMEFLSPEGWHYLFIKCMIWKSSFPSSRRFCRRQLKGSANAAVWSHRFRFLPEYMNLVMVKWLRFSDFVLSWLFSPKIVNNSSVTVKAANENGIKHIHVLRKFLFLHPDRRQANIFAADTAYVGYKRETVVPPMLLHVSSEWSRSFGGARAQGSGGSTQEGAGPGQPGLRRCRGAGEGAAADRISTCLKCTWRTNCLFKKEF